MQSLIENRKSIMLILIIAIVAVVLRELYNVHDCIESGGKWNPEKKICEAILKKSKAVEAVKK